MNYRHAYHAGNHADVLKHIALTRILAYLAAKDKPMAVLDAHAGIGLYDVSGVEAFKTGEWKTGIGKLLAAPLEGEARQLAKPYLDVIRRVNADGAFRLYPGSPELAVQLLRPADRIVLNELHPEDFQTTAVRYAADQRVRVVQLDATVAVKAELPFAERRGLVLVDPAFEVIDEADRMARLVEQGLRRMATACFLIWYPVKSAGFSESIGKAVAGLTQRPTLQVELMVREAFEAGGLAGSGLICINPPWPLHDELQILAPGLAKSLGQGNWGRGTVRWITPPN